MRVHLKTRLAGFVIRIHRLRYTWYYIEAAWCMLSSGRPWLVELEIATEAEEKEEFRQERLREEYYGRQ